MGKERLGKKLKVGDFFETTSKRMSRHRWGRCKITKELVYRKGDKDFFIKGSRRYFCEVKGISRTTTGFKDWQDFARVGFVPPYLRWWQFTYVVQIIED